MARLFALISIHILVAASVLAAPRKATDVDTIPLYPQTSHQAFKVGEELNYSLSYGWIKGGEAQMSVSDAQVNGKYVQHIVGKGRTVGLPEALYKVRDRYESFVDTSTGMPVKAVRSIKEGRYSYYNEVTYNRDSSTVTSLKSGVHSVHPDILDILSAIYYARNHNMNDNLKKGDIIQYMTYFTDEHYPLRIKYLGEETIKTDFGKVRCYLFSPVTEVGRVFESEDDVKVWFTKDENRIPIKIEFSVVVGSFGCELESYKGLKHPFSSIVKR